MPPGSLPPVRSPRQCIGPWLAMPRRLCVVIGPFIGWKSGSPMGPTRNGLGLLSTDVVGVAEVPGQAVEVAEDVAARARRLAVARGEAARRRGSGGRSRRSPARGCAARRAPTSAPRRGVDHRDAVVEAGEHVEPGARLVEHEAGRAAAADRDVVRRRRARRCRSRAPRCRRRRPCWSRRRRRRACAPSLVTAMPSGVARLRSRRHAGGRGHAVVDVLVQVARQHRCAAVIEHGDARLVQVAADSRTAKKMPGPSKRTSLRASVLVT